MADTGNGLEAYVIKNILSEKNTSDGTEGEIGFSFGLALVKRLVDDVQGTMDIEFAPNGDITFTITLHWAI